VRGVAGETAFSFESLFEAADHLIESRREPADLVGRSRLFDALREIATANALRAWWLAFSSRSAGAQSRRLSTRPIQPALNALEPVTLITTAYAGCARRSGECSSRLS